MKEKDEFILFFKIVLGKIASAARNLINSSPQTKATTFAFSSVFILLLCVKRFQNMNLHPDVGFLSFLRCWSTGGVEVYKNSSKTTTLTVMLKRESGYNSQKT